MCSTDVPGWLLVGGINGAIGLLLNVVVAKLIGAAATDAMAHVARNVQAERQPLAEVGHVCSPYAFHIVSSVAVGLCYAGFAFFWLIYGCAQVWGTESFDLKTQYAIDHTALVLPEGFVGCDRDIMSMANIILLVHFAVIAVLLCCGCCCGPMMFAAFKAAAAAAPRR